MTLSNLPGLIFAKAKRLPLIRGFWYLKPMPACDPGDLPRNLFLLWDTGLETAPEMVRFCVQSWIDLNPGWTIEILDQAGADRFERRDDFPDHVNYANYAAILRMKILHERGGVWADATTLCTRPLDDWLPQLFCQTGLFMFSVPGRDREISNWFMVGVKGNRILHGWHRALKLFRQGKYGRRPYYAAHYLYQMLAIFTPYGRANRRHMPRLSATPPHLMMHCLTGSKEATPDNLRAIAATPVHKLTYKKDISIQQIEDIISQAKAAQSDLSAK